MNFNSRDERYKSPFGAVPAGRRVSFRFPIGDWVTVGRVDLIVRDGGRSCRIEMKFLENKDGFNVFEATFTPEEADIFFYRFEMRNGDGVWYYGRGEGGESVCAHDLPEWQLTVYKPDYKTPDFAKGGIIYHVFVDRFRRSGTIKTKRNYRLHGSFSELPEIVSPDGKYYADDFFGGNLRGVEEKLDYLKSLGVTIIYLSPIFESFSNHRYDTGDYLAVDELAGSENDLRSLVEKARGKGIGIILDGVFNHSGADSRYFNKAGRYPETGAYQSRESRYYPWYRFDRWPDGYDCWWGCGNVPEFEKSNPDYRRLLFGPGGVIEKWEKCGIAGWRLDVADELPVDFMDELCSAVKRQDRNALIIGEVWEDASNKVSYSRMRPYLLGRQLDGVMNYPFMHAVINYVKGGPASEFRESVLSVVENYPSQSLNCCMSIIGTHDTVRIITELSGAGPRNGTRAEKRSWKMSAEDYAAARKKLRIASALQFALPGIPSVYYGDEAGVQGFEDPLNRAPFPWNHMDRELLAHYRALGRIRSNNREAFCGSIEFLRADNLLAFRRAAGNGDAVEFVFNCGNESAFYTPDTSRRNLMTGRFCGKRPLEIPPMSFVALGGRVSPEAAEKRP